LTRGGLALAAAVLAGGCGGGSGERAVETVTVRVTVREAAWVNGDCRPAGRAGAVSYRVCRDDGYGRIESLAEGQVERVPVSPPAHAGGHGSWDWAALSPDGRTFLAQWRGECELPVAFLVSAQGGAPRPVTGEEDWRAAPESVAIGWTADGDPVVRLPRAGCGRGTRNPGVFALDGDRRIRLVGTFEPTLVPIDLDGARAAA
jgi:hypothetical protein